MNPRFLILNRKLASEYTKNTEIPKTIIVSITDVESEPNHFYDNPNVVAIHRVQFQDVEKGEQGAITMLQAAGILGFVKAHLQNAEIVLVHCEGGVSRSAGVAAALMMIFKGDDIEVFENYKYCPNMTCYRSMLIAEYGEITKEQDELIRSKEILSIRSWSKHHLDCLD